MSKSSFSLSPMNKQAFTFDVTAEGAVTVKVSWGGEAQLEGFLFGPGSKVPHKTKTGSGALSLSQNVSSSIIVKGSQWFVQLYNPSNSAIKGTISVVSPSITNVRSLALHDQDIRRPAGTALLVYLMDRYVNDVQEKTDLDKQIKKALDALPNAKSATTNMVRRWKDIPVLRRKLIFGSKFGDLQFDSALEREYLRLNFLGQLDRRLPEIAPGIRGTMVRRVPTGLHMPPDTSNLPSGYENLEVRSGTIEHTYRIDYAGLYCQKDTNHDQLSNSDEPYVVFATTDGFKTWSRVSGVYDDVDSGETRGPSPALLSLFGEVGPEAAREISIISTVMENDFGDPNHFRDEIHTLVEIARVYAASQGIPIPDWAANLVVDAINWLLDTGDDKIGTAAVILDKSAFCWHAQANPVVSVGLAYRLIAGVHYGGEWWNNAKYWVMYNIRHDPAIPVNLWSEWENLGGILNSGTAVSSWAEGRLDVFVAGADNALHHKWFDGGWHSWESLAGNFFGSPAAVSWGPNRIDVFVRGRGGTIENTTLFNALWHIWYDGAWHDWESLGGTGVSSGPAVASWGEGRLDIFVRGSGGDLRHLWFDAEWHDAWETLGGKIIGNPAAVSWGPNRIDVFARGLDNALFHKWYDGGWHDWESLGGIITSEPAVASWAEGRLDVFVRGADKALWHKWYEDGWYEWESLGGIINSGPGAVSWGPNRIDVFARGIDNSMVHKWWGQHMR